LENYTKYRLKSAEELEGFLKETDNIFVIACNKCFKEFEALQEPDCDAFRSIAEGCGKKITGTAKIDFLCNKVQTERKLMDAIPELKLPQQMLQLELKSAK
jgi:electron transport complex protein RnfC